LQISENEDSPYIYYNSTFKSFKENNIIEELLTRRNKDIFSGSTGSGPHRDDYVFLYEEGKIFKNCASQGQKRTAAVSLKIAECKFIEQETKKKAIILIDDIFGELDEKRRRKMMDILKENNQIIITAVNPDLIQKDIFMNIQKFLVFSGGIVKKL
jgi:DNA replication and repair protein RecF